MPRTSRILCALSAAVCLAQYSDGPRSPAPSLVQFTLVAVDAKGAPVSNLRKDDISVTENGCELDLVDLVLDGAIEPAGPGKKLPLGLFTNRPEYLPAPPRNIVAIVIDDLNTPASDRAAVHALALRCLTAI